MNILSYFPDTKTPRAEQAALLLEIEAKWGTHDVFCVIAPTAVGKTEIAMTIARWQAAQRKTTNILEPTNVLVEQFAERYPEPAILRKKGFYSDRDEFQAAKAATKQAQIRLMNTYVYLAHRMYADVCVFDEAHQLVEILEDARDVRLWQHEYAFPTDLSTVAEVIDWIQAYVVTTPDEKLSQAKRDIIRIKRGATVVYEDRSRGGKPRRCLRVIDSTARETPQWLWPATKVRKVVFLSATVGAQDVTDLGLDTRRVAYFECASPIPVDRRPVRYEPAYNLSYDCIEKAVPYLAAKIVALLARHPDKGLIHLPYGLATKVRPLLTDSRLLFHDKATKSDTLDVFKASAPGEGKVLVASGLYEGIDLKYDDARWQLIGKVPYLSFADPQTKERATNDADWYAWGTIKRLLQAAGRIVRAPDDYGITYVCDSNFESLWRRNKELFPKYFRDAIQGCRK